MKEIFGVGDVVELLPYDEVSYHTGLTEAQWDKAIQHSPLTIRVIDGERYFVREVRWFFKGEAFVRFGTCSAYVEDLL